MKRLLSWFIMWLLSILVGVFTVLLGNLAGYVLTLIDELSIFFRVVCYLLGGATLLSIVLTPATQGPSIVIAASETICPSRKGTRYVAFSGIMLVLYVIEFILVFSGQGKFNPTVLIMCIYYVILLITGKSIVDEAGEAGY